MSVRVMSLVWDSFRQGGTEKLVMLAMADWCNDEGGSLHPSHDAVARKCCISRSQSVRILRKLTEDGWLFVVGNEFGGAPGTTKQYQVNIRKLRETGSADATGSVGATGSVHATGTGSADATPTGSTRASRRVASSTETGSTHATQTTSEPSSEPPVNLGADKPPPPKRATRLPENFSPNETGLAYAERKNVSVSAELEAFRNHHAAKGTTMLDWQAAWRTWCDKAVQFGRGGVGANGARASPKAPTRDEARQEVMRVLTGKGGEENGRERDITGQAVRIA